VNELAADAGQRFADGPFRPAEGFRNQSGSESSDEEEDRDGPLPPLKAREGDPTHEVRDARRRIRDVVARRSCVVVE